MAHKPTLEPQAIGRTAHFIVEYNTVGLLYQGQRYIRQLQAGEGPSLGERLTPGGMLVYVIDIAPHSLAWRVTLPAKGDKDLFSLTVNLKYRVANPERMVNEKVTDTEVLISRVLEPMLRKETRQYAFNKHTQLDGALEDAIRLADLPALCGLQLIDPPDIVINLTDDDHRRLKALDDLERAMRVTQSAGHTDELPSSDPAYNFSVTVNLGFKVSKPDDMPSDSLAECEKQLWPRIKRSLQKESRRFGIQEIDKATEAMQGALDDLEGYENYGLKVTSADLTVDLEKAARTRYVQLAEEKHNTEMQKAKLDGLKVSQQFYTDLIQQGDYAVLAVAVGKNEISVDELYQRMSKQERDRLNMQIDLLKVLRADNAKDEAQDYEAAKVLMNAVVGRATESPKKALPPQEAPAQLTDGSTPEEKDKP